MILVCTVSQCRYGVCICIHLYKTFAYTQYDSVPGTHSEVSAHAPGQCSSLYTSICNFGVQDKHPCGSNGRLPDCRQHNILIKQGSVKLNYYDVQVCILVTIMWLGRLIIIIMVQTFYLACETFATHGLHNIHVATLFTPRPQHSRVPSSSLSAEKPRSAPVLWP